MKVSVIMLTYNHRGTLARAIDSVLSQKCKFPFEIILADDCSTDGTAELCRDYASRYPGIIKFTENSINKGLLDNYFDCFLAAGGQYIADCAGDDYWIDSNKLQTQADFLDRNPEVTMVLSAWICHDTYTGQKWTVTCDNFPRDNVFDVMMSHSIKELGMINSSLYRREVLLERYHRDTRLFRCKDFSCEDFQIMAELAIAGKIAYLPQPMSVYTIGHKSLSNPGDRRKEYAFHTGLVELGLYLQQKYRYSSPGLNRFYRKTLDHIFSQAFRTGDIGMREKALGMFEKTGVPRPAKTRIKEILSSNPLIWKSSLWLLDKFR